MRQPFQMMIMTMVKKMAKAISPHRRFLLALQAHPLATWLCDPHVKNHRTDDSTND